MKTPCLQRLSLQTHNINPLSLQPRQPSKILYKVCNIHWTDLCTRFVELRPKNVVSSGASDTHNVCVCTLHQNAKLMLEGAKLLFPYEHIRDILTIPEDRGKYKHILILAKCNPPNRSATLESVACVITPIQRLTVITVFRMMTLRSWGVSRQKSATPLQH